MPDLFFAGSEPAELNTQPAHGGCCTKAAVGRKKACDPVAEALKDACYKFCAGDTAVLFMPETMHPSAISHELARRLAERIQATRILVPYTPADALGDLGRYRVTLNPNEKYTVRFGSRAGCNGAGEAVTIIEVDEIDD